MLAEDLYLMCRCPVFEEAHRTTQKLDPRLATTRDIDVALVTKVPELKKCDGAGLLASFWVGSRSLVAHRSISGAMAVSGTIPSLPKSV